LVLFMPIRIWRWKRQSVLKRRHIKFRRRGITQKKSTQCFLMFLTYNTLDIAHHLDQGPQTPIIGGPKGQFLKLRRAASNFSEISSWKCCL
jgi:hypothetical protein